MTTFSTLGTYLGAKHKALRDWASTTFLTSASRGVANGVASLGSDGKVPTSQLPAASTGGVQSVNGDSSSAVLLKSVPILDVNFALGMPAGATFARASSGTYFGADGLLHTAAPDQIRLQYDPNTGDFDGAVLEVAGENMAYYTSGYHQYNSGEGKGGWNATGYNGGTLTYTANDRAAPDGTLTATKVAFPANDGPYYRLDGAPPHNIETWSVWLYSEVETTITCAVQTTPSNNGLTTAAFDWLLPAGRWTRVHCNANGSGASTATSRTMAITSATGGTLWFWGVQSEFKYGPTSYMPSTATNGTRATDEMQIPLPSGYDGLRGSLVVDMWSYQDWGGGQHFAMLSDAMGSNSDIPHRLALNDTYNPLSGHVPQIYTYVYTDGHDRKYDFGNGAAITEVMRPFRSVRVGCAWQSGDFAVAFNGSVDGGTTQIVPPGQADRLWIGCPASWEGVKEGIYRYVRLYGERLSNAELGDLTKPTQWETADYINGKFVALGNIAQAAVNQDPYTLGTITSLAINHQATDASYYGINVTPVFRGLRGGNRGVIPISTTTDLDWSGTTGKYGYAYGASFQARRHNSFDTGSNASSFLYGITGSALQAYTVGDAALTGSAYGGSFTANAQNGTFTNAYGAIFTAAAAGNIAAGKHGTVGTAYGISAGINASNLGTVGTAYTIYIRTPGRGASNKGTITDLYGLYIDRQNSESAGQNWALFQADAGDKSFFAGKVMVGTQYGATPLAASGGANSGGIASILQLDTIGNQNGDGSAIVFTRVQDASTIKARIGVEKREVSNNETDIVISAWDGAALTERVRVVGATGTVVIKSVVNAANDAAAASGGVPVGGIYRNGSALMIRVS
jgi:hypothetical protein